MDTQSDNYIKIYFEFSNLVSRILEVNGFAKLARDVVFRPGLRVKFDLLAVKDNRQYIFELKFHRYKATAIGSLRASINQFINMAQRFNDDAKVEGGADKPQLVFVTSLSLSEMPKSLVPEGIEMWDINTLHRMSLKTGETSEKFKKFLIDHEIGLKEEEIENLAGSSAVAATDSISVSLQGSLQRNGAKLVEQFSFLRPGKDWVKYEKVCQASLEYLFADHLSGWNSQSSTEDKLHRFDLICRIRSYDRDASNSFWAELSLDCNTRYVIFEFKNYTKAIGQGEIYTTEKYLFARAFRTVAFVIARSGYSKNALMATYGILRETGKVIVTLRQEDIELMLLNKDDDLDPTEVLRQKLDELFIKLPK